MSAFIPSLPRRGRQHGAALVVVLILLLVMTWMGVSSMRGTAMGERMSAGIYDRSIAFQAAEAALREGEAIIATRPVFPTAGCSAGLCALRADLVTADLMRWEDSGTAWREATSVLEVDNSGTSIDVDPELVIESMGMGQNWLNCKKEIVVSPLCESPRYLLTARSSEAGRARVLLQVSVAEFD